MPEDGFNDVQAPDEDTPEAPAAPAEDTPTPEQEIDWQARYESLRSFSDQRFNEQAQQLQTYEEQLEAQQPQPVPEVGDDDWFDNPLEDPRIAAQVARLDALEARLAAQAEQETLSAEAAREEAFIDGSLDRIEAEYNDELTDAEAEMIGNFALSHRDKDGNPDVDLAYATYRASLEQRKTGWVEGKRSDAAPAAGPSAVPVGDRSTTEGRLQEINERIALMDEGGN